jgi:hypothetical protein
MKTLVLVMAAAVVLVAVAVAVAVLAAAVIVVLQWIQKPQPLSIGSVTSLRPLLVVEHYQHHHQCPLQRPGTLEEE